MAKEIQFDHTTGTTCYAQLRNAVGQIWNTSGSAFEAYNTANIADYDLAATEQGTASGLFAADMPAATAGFYNLVAKERAGGAPAEADRTIGVGEIYWTGTAVTPLTGDAFARLGAPVGASISADIAGVPAATFDLASGIETSITLRQAIRLILAASAGKLSGAATTTIVIRNVGDSKDRITATVDADGNRNAVTVDGT